MVTQATLLTILGGVIFLLSNPSTLLTNHPMYTFFFLVGFFAVLSRFWPGVGFIGAAVNAALRSLTATVLVKGGRVSYLLAIHTTFFNAGEKDERQRVDYTQPIPIERDALLLWFKYATPAQVVAGMRAVQCEAFWHAKGLDADLSPAFMEIMYLTLELYLMRAYPKLAGVSEEGLHFWIDERSFSHAELDAALEQLVKFPAEGH